ncbi:MAG: hypothetical protein ACT4OJ_08730 [Bacteroidota bacterium]
MPEEIYEPQDFWSELLLAVINRLKERVPEIKYVNLDLAQLEVYTLDSPSVSWPCYLIDFPDANYDDLHQGEQSGEFTMVGRLGFNPFSQTSNLQPTEVIRKGLAYFSLEQKIINCIHGWQPLKPDGSALCQPFSRRRVATERREEDAFRVRANAFTSAYMDDGAAPERATIQPTMEIDSEIF